MIERRAKNLAELYEADETAWLDATATLIREKRTGDLDYVHLAEFLEDMAKRDRREIRSRLRVLLGHLLKWLCQQDKRTNSWRGTIIAQRQALDRELRSSGALRNHAEEILAECYSKAVEWAVVETGLPATAFPADCPWTLEQVLSAEVLGE